MNEHPFTRQNLNQSILRQSRQGFTDWGAGDAKLLGQFAFIKAQVLFSIINIKRLDTIPQHFVNMVLQGEIDDHRF